MGITRKCLAAGLLAVVGLTGGSRPAAAVEFGPSDLADAVLRSCVASFSVPNDPARARDTLKFAVANLLLQPGDRLCIGAALSCDRGYRAFGIGDASSEDGSLYCELEDGGGGKLASARGEDLDGFACKAKYSPRNGGLLKVALARWYVANLLLFAQATGGREAHDAILHLSLYVVRAQVLCFITLTHPVLLAYRIREADRYRARMKTVRAD